MRTLGAEPMAMLGGLWARELVEVSSDVSVLDGGGRWAVVLPYVGNPVLLRFADWSPERPAAPGDWRGPSAGSWISSMDRGAYLEAVEATRAAIAEGAVYQANICRILGAEIGEEADVAALADRLATGNPSPYGGYIRAPEAGIEVATASPELFLARRERIVRSGPIKGTGALPEDLQDKDAAENIMIVDLVRNDLSRVCMPGSVAVPRLLAIEQHPGLVHLVSHVQGTLREGIGWQGLLDAAFPPGSVTGAPKSSALSLIAALETAQREVYCGAVGWVDADRQEGCLAVAIRTFWLAGGMVKFGTGAGITWGSDPEREWAETELKAARLVGLASD